MSYEVNSVASSVSILTKNLKPAFEKICDTFPDIISELTKERESFFMAIEDLRFYFDADTSTDADRVSGVLHFEYGYWREDEQSYLLHIIAPYVEKGSYITFSDCHGDHWMVYFNGERDVHYQGVATFPGCPIDVQVNLL